VHEQDFSRIRLRVCHHRFCVLLSPARGHRKRYIVHCHEIDYFQARPAGRIGQSELPVRRLRSPGPFDLRTYVQRSVQSHVEDGPRSVFPTRRRVDRSSRSYISVDVQRTQKRKQGKRGSKERRGKEIRSDTEKNSLDFRLSSHDFDLKTILDRRTQTHRGSGQFSTFGFDNIAYQMEEGASKSNKF